MVESSTRSRPFERQPPRSKMCEMKTIGAVVLLAALGLGVVGAVEPVRLSDGAVGRGEGQGASSHDA